MFDSKTLTPDGLYQKIRRTPSLVEEFQTGLGSACYISKDGAFVSGEGRNRIKTKWSNVFNDKMVSRGTLAISDKTGRPLGEEIFAYRTPPSWATQRDLDGALRF